MVITNSLYSLPCSKSNPKIFPLFCTFWTWPGNREYCTYICTVWYADKHPADKNNQKGHFYCRQTPISSCISLFESAQLSILEASGFLIFRDFYLLHPYKFYNHKQIIENTCSLAQNKEMMQTKIKKSKYYKLIVPPGKSCTCSLWLICTCVVCCDFTMKQHL